MNEFTLSVRAAEPADAPLALALIRLSMGEEVDWLFGQAKGHPTYQVMLNLFQKKGNRLSYEFCRVAEVNGRFAGLLLAFPGRRLRGLELATGWQLIRIIGIAETLRLARSMSIYGLLVEALPDEFYVSNLAVFEEDQGKGIGTALLEYADSAAREAGLGKNSLIVTFDNPAKQLYERYGYQLDQSYIINHPILAHGSGGFHRMVKVLPPDADSLKK